MNKLSKIFLLVSFLLITALGVAQGPPDPNPDPTGGSGNDIGGNAPIGTGTSILLVLGAVYGTSKIHNNRKKELI